MTKSITVWSLLYYLTEVDGITWRSDDYLANKIIKVVKGKPFNGYFDAKIGGKNKRFTQNNGQDFLPPLFITVAAKIKEIIKGEFTLVPIPNSNATIANNDDFRTFSHARGIAASIGPRATVVPALRWKTARIPSHQDGSRDPQVHFENLKLVAKPTGPIMIFDDVLTTGSQMIGSYRRLAHGGLSPSCVLVIGRATKLQKEPVFGWVEESVSVIDSPIDWDEF